MSKSCSAVMPIFSVFLLSAVLAASPARAQAASSAACPTVLQHTVSRLQDEAPQALCQYQGKVLLIVNTASYCGFTSQYRGLEDLHRRYQARGLVVLGFPSNDFAQEKSSNREIAEFCESTFGVRFPMFVRTSVRGSGAHPLFRQLAEKTGRAPLWNFHKYLVARDGRVIRDYTSMTSPDDAGLVAEIEKQLAPR